MTFRNGSLTIAGTLSLPSGSGPFPAVVLLSGSGPQNSDSELFGFRPFKLIADSFVERGIAVLNQSLVVMRSRWMRFFIGFDPSMALRRVACPVLAVFGGRDQQIPEVVNRMRLEAALREAGNHQVTVRVYADANHLFMQAVTGQPAEYLTLPKAFVAPLLDDMAGWIASR